MGENVETPWEFYPDDDLREEPPMAAEDQAMHIEIPGATTGVQPEAPPQVVHYLDDEDPETPDLSVVPEDDEITPGVEELLIRQHYMTADPKKI